MNGQASRARLRPADEFKMLREFWPQRRFSALKSGTVGHHGLAEVPSRLRLCRSVTMLTEGIGHNIVAAVGFVDSDNPGADVGGIKSRQG